MVSATTPAGSVFGMRRRRNVPADQPPGSDRRFTRSRGRVLVHGSGRRTGETGRFSPDRSIADASLTCSPKMSSSDAPACSRPTGCSFCASVSLTRAQPPRLFLGPESSLIGRVRRSTLSVVHELNHSVGVSQTLCTEQRRHIAADCVAEASARAQAPPKPSLAARVGVSEPTAPGARAAELPTGEGSVERRRGGLRPGSQGRVDGTKADLRGIEVDVRQDRADRTLRLAGAAIDALVGMHGDHLADVVDAVDRADLDAGLVFGADAGTGDDVRHDDQPIAVLTRCHGRRLPMTSRYGPSSSQATLVSGTGVARRSSRPRRRRLSA